MSIRGEYWIDDSGFTMYADGDVGDWSHEGIVIDNVRQNIADEFGIDIGYGFYDWEEIKREIAQEYLDSLSDAQRKQIESEYDVYEIAELAIEQHPDISIEMEKVAEGFSDARDYAMKNFGWKAVRGNYIDTWTLTKNDFGTIYRGLGDILEQEGVGEEEDDEEEFTITNHSTGQSKSYTFPQIEQAALGKISPTATTGLKTTPEDWSKAATAAGRQMDISKLHPYYQRRTFPLGDSHNPKGMFFKEWLLDKGDM